MSLRDSALFSFFFFFLSMLTPHLVQLIKVTWCTVVLAHTYTGSCPRQPPSRSPEHCSDWYSSVCGQWERLQCRPVLCSCRKPQTVGASSSVECQHHTHRDLTTTTCTYIPSAQPVWLVETRFPYLSYWHCSDPKFYQDRRTWLDW